MNDFRYMIPVSGISIIDSIQIYFGDEILHDISFRRDLECNFRLVCRDTARNNQLLQEEKIIWARAAITTLNQTYLFADLNRDYGVAKLTTEFCAILVSEFLQIPSSICAIRIAKEIGETKILNETISRQPVHDGESPCIEPYIAFLLEAEMGANREFYQKKVCLSCDVQDCPYDVYLRDFQESCEGNEKYPAGCGGIQPKDSLSNTIASHQELKQAIDDNIIDSSGRLLVPRSEFVLYCNRNHFFSTGNTRRDWIPIDNLLTDSKGKKVSAEQFAQSFQDLQRVGKVR